MLTIEHPAALAATRAAAMPSIRPVHDPVERRQGDLSFNVDTGGRPCFRVLIARERSLFAPEHASARNASNFYDSLRDGMLNFDGAPCFYIVPRAVLHTLLPATKLYYTLIAYADRAGKQPVYAHAPQSLPSDAPAVGIAGDVTSQSLGLMFGMPIGQLLRVDSNSFAWEQAAQEVGEDLSDDDPQEIGLAAEDHEDASDDFALEQAAAYEAQAEEEGHQVSGADDAYADAANYEALAASEGVHRPVMEAAALGDPDALENSEAWPGELAQTGSAAQSLSDDYNDGYDTPISSGVPGSGPQSFALEHEQNYGAEHELDDAQAFTAPQRAAMPEMLPDEDADRAHVAQAGEFDQDDADAVEIEGAATAQALDAPEPALNRRPLDIEACKALLGRIAPFESGSEGFARVNADAEFAGRFGTAHPAYQRYHLGLTFGAFPFVQEHGTLGQLLMLMRQRDRTAFDNLFPDAEALLTVTNGDGPRAWNSPDGFSARLAPVAGKLLWEEPWLGRFRRAGQHPPFQGAQNELAARLYIQPILPIAKRIGLDSEQALTLIVDRAVQLGPDSALTWVVEAVTPVDTPASRQQALARLGHADLQAFQVAQHLPITGIWDPITHASLIGALRGTPNSPVPVLSCAEMVDAMLRHAQGTPWEERMMRLRNVTSAERHYQL